MHTGKDTSNFKTWPFFQMREVFFDVTLESLLQGYSAYVGLFFNFIDILGLKKYKLYKNKYL